MANNDAWLSELKYIPLLRDVGRHFTINRMLTMDSVKLRLDREQPLTFLEFNYMILQGYDFVELNKRYGCTLQMGGSDQWGNIVQGVELGRRMRDVQLFGLTSPLIATASGAKMGKTASGAVWLNRRAPVALRLLAILAQYGRRRRRAGSCACSPSCPSPRSRGSSRSPARRSIPPRRYSRPRRRVCAMARRPPPTPRPRPLAPSPAGRRRDCRPSPSGTPAVPVIDVIVALGMAASKSDARRLIEQGGVKLNDRPVPDPAARVTAADLEAGGTARLSVGKKRHGLIRSA